VNSVLLYLLLIECRAHPGGYRRGCMLVLAQKLPLALPLALLLSLVGEVLRPSWVRRPR
jgi:hypothetical protein